MRNTIVLFFVLVLMCGLANGQGKGHFQNKYLQAKEFYKVGNYEKAVYAFKDCMPEHKNNPFHIYAHYHLGLSAYKAGMYADARFALVKLIREYPDWPQIDEAKYLMANIAFEEHDLKKAYKYVGELKDSSLMLQTKAMQSHFLSVVEDSKTLLNVLNDYPGQKYLAATLASRLNKEQSSIEDMYMLEYLVQDYELNPQDFGHGTFRESEFKQVYNVAVMLPLKVKGKDPRRAAKYYEMITGIEMALDSLNQDSVSFNLNFYDTQQDSATVAELLTKPEMMQMDLFIGPVYPKPSQLVSNFAHSHQINFVNPIYQNNKTIVQNDFAYLWLPSYRDIGRSLAKYAQDSCGAGDIVILYGEGIRDSVIAHSMFALLDTVQRFKVTKFQKVTQEDMPEIPRWIRKANEIEELQLIAAITEENLAGAYMVTALEQEDLKIPVFAPDKWLNIQTNTLEQYYRRNVHFYFSDFIDLDRSDVQAFRKGFRERMNIPPIKFSHGYLGHDLMLYWGSFMKRHGNLFFSELHNAEYSLGATTAGVDYATGNSNNVVQLLRFKENFDFEWVNAPAKKN